MEKIRGTVQEEDEYLFTESVTRNVILMGRSRTGKTTMAHVLGNAAFFPKDLALFSETKSVEFHPVATTVMKNGVVYAINIVDTPGMYDQVDSQGKRISNQYIIDITKTCMTEDMTHIHCFAFVFNLHNGINTDDIRSMVEVKNNYPGVKDHIILLLTHCEESSSEKLQGLVDQFFKHETVVKNGLKEYFGNRVFYMGCLRTQLKDNPNEEAAAQQITNIMEMRNKFLNFIFEKKSYYNIHRDDYARAGPSSSYPCRQQ